MTYQGILKQYWGCDSFRGLQEDIITNIGNGEDMLRLMPTGGGKSVTFQVPAPTREGLCIIITPLIALMKDQVQNLKKHGTRAIAIYSGMTQQEIVVVLKNCIFDGYKFPYISSEWLDTEIFRAEPRSMKISMIAVDEGHCISQWGYNFRPAYLEIADIRELVPDASVLALTATAIPEVVRDIRGRLHFHRENVFRMSFERKNLAYIARPTDSGNEELLHTPNRVQGSAIIYVRSRRKTKETTELLVNKGITTGFYHARLDSAAKDSRQKRWRNGENRVVVATNAFGIGIDKPDIRIVIHPDLPDSPKAYFQEAGQAGCGGQKAYAAILYAKSDKTTLNKCIADTFSDEDYIKDVYEHLQYHYQMAMGDGLGCVYDFSLEEFCRKFKYFLVPADSALKILTQAGYLEYTDEQDNASRIIFTIRRDGLYKLRGMGKPTEKLIRIVFRSCTGVFADYAYISKRALSVRTGLTRRQTYDLLVMLSKYRIVGYIPHKKTPYIIYTRGRVNLHYLQVPRAIYEERKEHYEKRVHAMAEYVTSGDVCRSRMLLRCFGKKDEHNCGQCDVCLSHYTQSGVPQSSFNELREQVTTLLKDHPMTPTEIALHINTDKEQLGEVIRFVLDEGLLSSENGLLTKETS